MTAPHSETLQPPRHPGSNRFLTRRRLFDVLSITIFTAAIASFLIPAWRSKPEPLSRLPASQLQTADDLKNLDPQTLTPADLARINLLCAQGITAPASQRSASRPALPRDLNTTLQALSQLALRVKAETAAALPDFRRHPSTYSNSEAFFRLIILDQTLMQRNSRPSPGAGPNNGTSPPELTAAFQQATTSTRGRINYRNPDSLFLSGVLAADRPGTAINLPFMYVAVGRLLGYPLKLALAKGHVFVRWEDGPESFDIEPTAESLRRTNNAYYESWPVPIATKEVVSEGYLRSLSPAEEAALCVLLRVACLEELGRNAESQQMRALASQWTSTPAVLGQMNHLVADGARGKPMRMRLGELADRYLAAREMMRDARQRQNTPGPGDAFGMQNMPPGVPGFSAPRAANPGFPSGAGRPGGSPYPGNAGPPRSGFPPFAPGTSERRPGMP